MRDRELKIAVFVCLILIAFVLGINTKHWQVRERALSIESSDCYSQKDMDYIIFGSSQE